MLKKGKGITIGFKSEYQLIEPHKRITYLRIGQYPTVKSKRSFAKIWISETETLLTNADIIILANHLMPNGTYVGLKGL